MLATDESVPILDYEPFEDIVHEPEVAAGKGIKQVTVQVGKDCPEVESRWIVECCWSRRPQSFAQGLRPVPQHGHGSTTGLDYTSKIFASKTPLLLSQSTLFLYRAEEEDQSQERTEFHFEHFRWKPVFRDTKFRCFTGWKPGYLID
jgi:hypothetical protein